MNDPTTPAAPEPEPDGASAVAPGPGEALGDPASAAPVLPEPGSPEPILPEPIPHAGARYALLRLLMLAAVGGILYVIGIRGWALAFAAVLVSGLVSLFLFMKQRNDAAVNIEHTVDHWKHRRDHEDVGLTQE